MIRSNISSFPPTIESEYCSFESLDSICLSMDGGIEMNSAESNRSGRQSTKSAQSDILTIAKTHVENVAESLTVTCVMSVATIWALFDDDIRLAATEKDADIPFEIIISICFFLFLLEICASCFYKDGYAKLPIPEKFHDPSWSVRFFNCFHFGSFYFWLDLIATFSLVTEVQQWASCCCLPFSIFLMLFVDEVDGSTWHTG